MDEILAGGGCPITDEMRYEGTELKATLGEAEGAMKTAQLHYLIDKIQHPDRYDFPLLGEEVR